MSDLDDPTPQPAASQYRWVILTTATLTQAGTAFVFLGVGALAGFIQEALDLSGAQTGLLITAFALAPLAAMIPTGRWLDRGSERLVITSGALLLAAGAMLAGLSGAYVPVLLLLFVGGAGYSASQPGGSKVVAGWFPIDQRGLAMGIRQTGLPLGGAIAAAILPVLASEFGWQRALVVAALVAGATGLVFGAAYRPLPYAFPSPSGGFALDLRHLLRARSVRLAMVAG
ncbi:MAG: MFS transporter, partial [Acidimicrobiia bacterium]|nr:MFS transporter [Acidimicrobiia bacterium]